MNSFSETLHQVRLERGFTQEKLARELNVSRQTISHWENGRAYPDIDTIKLISQILDHNFLTEAEEITETAAEAPAAETPVEAAAKVPVRAGTWRRAIIAVLAVSALIAISFCAGFMFNGSGDDTDVPEKEPLKVEGSVDEAYSYAWFNQTHEPVEGQAYVEIVPRENPVHPSDEDYWTYYFDVNFSGDAVFTLDRIVYHDFYRGFNNHEARIFTKETFIAGYGTDTYAPGDSFTWKGGFPVQRLDAVCIAIEGTDSNGNKLVFTGMVELTDKKK